MMKDAHSLTVFLHRTDFGVELRLDCCCGKFERVCPQENVSDTVLQEALAEHLKAVGESNSKTRTHDRQSVLSAMHDLTPLLSGSVAHLGHQERYTWEFHLGIPEIVVLVTPLNGQGYSQRFTWGLVAGESQE